jgi:hypothetical protein
VLGVLYARTAPGNRLRDAPLGRHDATNLEGCSVSIWIWHGTHWYMDWSPDTFHSMPAAVARSSARQIFPSIRGGVIGNR